MSGKHDRGLDDEQETKLLLTGPIVIRGLGRSVKDAFLPGRPSRHRAFIAADETEQPGAPTTQSPAPEAAAFPPARESDETGRSDGPEEDRVEDRRTDDSAPIGPDDEPSETSDGTGGTSERIDDGAVLADQPTDAADADEPEVADEPGADDDGPDATSEADVEAEDALPEARHDEPDVEDAAPAPGGPEDAPAASDDEHAHDEPWTDDEPSRAEDEHPGGEREELDPFDAIDPDEAPFDGADVAAAAAEGTDPSDADGVHEDGTADRVEERRAEGTADAPPADAESGLEDDRADDPMDPPEASPDSDDEPTGEGWPDPDEWESADDAAAVTNADADLAVADVPGTEPEDVSEQERDAALESPEDREDADAGPGPWIDEVASPDDPEHDVPVEEHDPTPTELAAAEERIELIAAAEPSIDLPDDDPVDDGAADAEPALVEPTVVEPVAADESDAGPVDVEPTDADRADGEPADAGPTDDGSVESGAPDIDEADAGPLAETAPVETDVDGQVRAEQTDREPDDADVPDSEVSDAESTDVHALDVPDDAVVAAFVGPDAWPTAEELFSRPGEVPAAAEGATDEAVEPSGDEPSDEEPPSDESWSQDVAAPDAGSSDGPGHADGPELLDAHEHPDEHAESDDERTLAPTPSTGTTSGQDAAPADAPTEPAPDGPTADDAEPELTDPDDPTAENAEPAPTDPDDPTADDAEPAPAAATPALVAPAAMALGTAAAEPSGGGRPPRGPRPPVRRSRPVRERFGREAIGIAVLVVLALVCGGLITAVVIKTQKDAALAAQEAADYTPPPLATPEPTATGPVVAVIGDGTTTTAASGVSSAERWSALVGAALDGSVTTDASSGMGYAAKGASGETFVQAAATVPSNADVVVFFGGAEDSNIAPLSLAKAATDALAAARKQAPDAKLLVVGPAISAGVSASDLTATRNIIRTAAGIVKATWVDPIDDGWLSSSRQSASSPSALTASDEKAIASKMESAITKALG